jgi:hypothetical protein
MPVRRVSIDSLQFDVAGWRRESADRQVTLWSNERNEFLSRHFFSIAPDLPRGLKGPNELARFYWSMVTNAGGAVLEAGMDKRIGLLAIRTIFKFPMQPTGFTFIGSYTIPFVDSSFVLKIQTVETGFTGIREAAVFAKLGCTEASDAQWTIPTPNGIEAPVKANKGDDEQYDLLFPDHPLSRARAILDGIAFTISAAPEIAALKPWPLFS